MSETTTDQVTVTIDGQEVTAEPGELVIDVAERHGVYIPRFCYHPRMRSVGMCRMCIVDIDTGRGPALQPSCMIEVADEMQVETHSDGVKKAQDGVLEFLLINHPLDCPVCDKGGECPLQDQTVAYGPGESRFVEEKRHFAKPIPLSEIVLLDRERCILCDRCTRFAKEVAGDPQIHFMDRGAMSEVNIFPDQPFDSYFSGNTIQICPVGALTSTQYRFRARPWDLQQSESTCTSCSVGCRTAVQTSRNRVLRYLGVDVDPVNWGWLCDKGRFDHEAVHHEERLSGPLVRGASRLEPAGWGEAVSRAAEAISAAAPDRLAVLGGARLTNESAFAWAKLVKGCWARDNVDAQLGDGLPAELVLGLPRATIDEACAPGGTVLLLGPDIKEELPVLYLRLRHAVVEDGVRMVEVSPVASGLTPYASTSVRYRPGEGPATLSRLVAEGALGDGALTVVAGRASLAEQDLFTVHALAQIVRARPDARLLPALRRGNVHGALDMGLAPGLLPGRVPLSAGSGLGWPNLPRSRGLDALGSLRAAADGTIDTLVLLGADPLSDFPDRQLAGDALAGARTVVAVDTYVNPSVEQANVVLAAAGYAETDGTTTNLEGRISPVAAAVTAPGTARADWIIAADLAARLGHDLEFGSPGAIRGEIERVSSMHAKAISDAATGPGAEAGVVARSANGIAFTPPDGDPPSIPVDTLRAPRVRVPPLVRRRDARAALAHARRARSWRRRSHERLRLQPARRRRRDAGACVRPPWQPGGPCPRGRGRTPGRGRPHRQPARPSRGGTHHRRGPGDRGPGGEPPWRERPERSGE